MAHKCPAPGHTETIENDDLLMCSAAWYRVPKPLRNAVWRAYKRGAGVGSKSLLAAQKAAIASLERSP
jgi:hypothetical protein